MDDDHPLAGAGGKADFASGLADKGALAWDGSAEDSFTRDLELHAYRISAVAGAAFEIEAGADQGLELFLYRPTDDGHALVDRDSGDTARLAGELDERATYLAIVGLEDPTGRGDYRIDLACTSDACAVGDEEIELERIAVPTALEDWQELIPDFECAWMQTMAFSYDWTASSSPDVAKAKWSYLFALKDDRAIEWIDVFEHVPGAGAGGLVDFLDQITSDATFEGFEAATEIDHGDYQIGRFDFSWDCAASVTCSGSGFLFLDHEQRRVYAVDFGSADEC